MRKRFATLFIMEERIRRAVEAALKKAGAQNVAFTVEWPADPSHGDYSTNVALKAFGPIHHGNFEDTLGKKSSRVIYQYRPGLEKFQNPREFAEIIASALKDALAEDAARVEVAGAGFVNVSLSRVAIGRALVRAVSEGETWGKGTENDGQRVMVEYTDPNPFKEMHIGHLMSNAIGEAIARLIEFSGARVMRANYQGDVGPHVAKALWGLKEAKVAEPASASELGKAYAHGARAYEESETAKVEIDAINRAVYRGEDRELMELWRKGRDISLAAFEEVYRTLGTKFDYYFFESETSSMGLVAVRDGLAKGLFETSEGAVIYRGEKKGLFTLVFVTSQGTPTYEAKEIGLAFLKEERWPSDRSVIITAAEQTGHFAVARAALAEVAPLLGAKTTHVPHGLLRLSSGKMSSREGNVITALSLINDLAKKAARKNPDPAIADAVAVAAVKYMILRQAAGADVVFDPEKSLSLEGDSGPYLQYAYVRAKSVLAQTRAENASIYGSILEGPAEPYLIERLIVRFPEVVLRARSELAPHHVTQYLTTLAGEWNSFYAKERIIGGEHEACKLTVARAFANTMRNGLTLLGISAPGTM